MIYIEELGDSESSRKTLLGIVREVATQIFIPLTVGGGVKSLDDFEMLLANGADKVSINSAAIAEPGLISAASNKYGSSTVIVSVDYKKGSNGEYAVWMNGGKKKTALHPVNWAQECEKRGAGEILLSSIDQDGTKKGLDLSLTKSVVDAVSIPVVTSGGCGLASDFVDGYIIGGASAVAAGTYFCFKDQGFMQVRAHIKNANIPIRIGT